jgi:glycosyltransferase involved in cell wall biosynthesis
LRCAALYLSPARYDPFGLLPLQAALHGCALLLSDIPSYRELWDGAACFFQTGNAADLRRQWESLLSDRVRLAEVQSACHARATSYTTQSMVDRYCALYARVTSRVAA